MLPASDAFAARLESCDAVVVPSRFEAFGLVATEARMAGRPVLVADVDGLPEQVAQGGGLAAPMHDAAAIARSLRRLLQADLPAMGRAARASVRSQHDDIVAAWQAVIRKADPSNQNKTGRSPVRLAGV
jgi:glycosyltransferase involved in cell wall biosynthesis